MALLVLALLADLPGFTDMPTVDRDEARFAEASREMAVGGWPEGYAVPSLQGRPRLSKPPLVYWLQAASVTALGIPYAGPWPGHIWAYRLPSLAAMLIAVWATWRMGRTMFAPPAPWTGAALLACAPVVLWEARQARADAVLLAATVLAQWSLWRIWSRRRRARPHIATVAGLWLAMTAGMLTKGPVTPMVCGLTAISLSAITREWAWMRRLRPATGLVVAAALVGSWAAVAATRVGWPTLLTIIGDEVVGRSVAPREGHWGVPGYHLALLVVLLWPAALFVPAGLLRAWRRARLAGRARMPSGATLTRGRAAELFCMAWAAPAWIVFELVQTKLPHYPLPLYPPLALLAARAALSVPARTWLGRPSRLAWSMVGLTLVCVLPLTTIVASRSTGTAASATGGIALVGAATICLGNAYRHLLRDRGRALILATVALLLGAGVCLSWLPRLDAAWLTSRLVAVLAGTDPTGTRPLAAVGYHEDSLVFATAGRIERIDAADLSRWLLMHPHGLAVVPATLATDLPARRAIATIDGVHYSKGQRLSLTIIESVTAPAEPATPQSPWNPK